MRILFLGDIVGKAGRRGVTRQLPLWREQFKPDLIVANVENIAHGAGVNAASLTEMRKLGIQVMTGGNHSMQGKDAALLLADKTLPLIRPLNASQAWPGRGFMRIKTGETNVTVVNLIGQHGMRDYYDSPFAAIETLLEQEDVKRDIIIVDWHAEATSEKTAMGWFLDGRVSAVLGTHTHVPTADEKILPKGTAFISDVGMNGAYYSVIGINTGHALEKMAKNFPAKFNVAEDGPAEVNAVLVEIEKTGKKAVGINRLRSIVDA